LVGGVSVGSGVADGAGVYTVLTSPLPDGVATITASDGGVLSPGSVLVTVDGTAPAIGTLADIAVVAATSASTAVASYSGTATDALDAAPTLVFSLPSGTAFGLGTTSVTATATDKAGNVSTRAFDVTVFRPSLSLATESDTGGSSTDQYTSDSTPTLVGQTLANAAFSVLADGVILGSGVAGGDGRFGFTLPTLADGLRVLTATTSGALLGTIAVIIDTVAPVIAGLPGVIVALPLNASGAAGNFTGSATDALDGAPSLNFSVPPGTLFPLGVSTVTATATDRAGNISTQSFTVTVFQPSLILDGPSDTGSSGTDRYTADNTPTFTGRGVASGTVTLLSDGVAVGSSLAAADGTFSVTAASLGDGSHVVTAVSGGATLGSVSITVDTAGPVITPPNTVNVLANDSSGAVATFTATTSDALDQAPTISFSVASGARFGIGTTVVVVTSTDLAGNTSTLPFNVVVSPPVIMPSIGGTDSGFGAGTGVIAIIVPQAQLVAIDAVPLSSGQLLSSGLDSANNKLVITRINLDGSLDTSFGTEGILRVDLPSDFSARRIQVDPSGFSYVLGNTISTGQPAVVRYTPGGVQDIGLANGGLLVIAPFSPGDTVDSIQPLGTGGFLVGGSKLVGGRNNAALARVTAAGAADRRFARGLYLRPGGALDTFNSIAIGPKNVIYATGVTGDTASSSALTVRFSSAGRPDSAFTKLTSIPGFALASGQKVIVQADGKVLISVSVAATSADARAGRLGTAAVRFTIRGALDTTFSGGGITVTSPPPSAPPGTLSLVGFEPLSVASLLREFDRAASSIVSLPGGKVRQFTARTQGPDTLLVQRQLVADAVNLATNNVTVRTNRPYRPNARVAVNVRVDNTGTLATPKTVPVVFFFSADPVLDDADIQLPGLTAQLGLKAGGFRVLKFTVIAPAAQGSYFLIARVNSGNGAFADLTSANDVKAAALPLSVAGTAARSASAITLFPFSRDRLFPSELLFA